MRWANPRRETVPGYIHLWGYRRSTFEWVLACWVRDADGKWKPEPGSVWATIDAMELAMVPEGQREWVAQEARRTLGCALPPRAFIWEGLND